MSQALYRVYRPVTFSELTGQKHVSTTIQNQFAMGKLAHAYLFTGPRGVGKTTTARLLAKLANCENVTNSEPCNACDACQLIASGSALDIHEIDAASNTDVENVRENIIKSVRFAPNQLKKKVYIIDEVHMLSTSSFNALLKTLEEPPAHVLFILATTEIHKVPETIISRCQRFDFRRIPKDEMLARLQTIVEKEQVNVDREVLEQIAKQSEGCARDAESLLGQILALGEKTVTLKEASLIFPASSAVYVEAFVQAILAHETMKAITDLNSYIEQGIDLKTFLDDVIERLREMLLAQENLLFVRQAIPLFLDARIKIRGEHLPQLPLELAIVELGDGGGNVGEAVAAGFSLRGVEKKVSNETQQDFQKQGVDSGLSLRGGPKADEAISALLTTQETVFDTIPVISLDEVRQKWPQVFEQIKECNASLPLFMQSCSVSDVTDDRVELGFEFELYVQTVNKEKNRQVIEKALEQVMGKPMKIRAVTIKPKKDEILDALVSQFGGGLIN